MANLCDTQYKITGEKKAVADLWNTLQEMNVDEKNIWLGDLANHYGIDYKAKGFSVRGEIYWAEYEEDGDYALLSVDTETAWTACNDFFNALNDKFEGALSISYREIECGCGIFCVHDEGEHFPEECCVSANGEPFEVMCEEPFDTLADAIEEWCEKMDIGRDGRSDEEMHEYIKKYEYKDSDTYFYIKEFEFE